MTICNVYELMGKLVVLLKFISVNFDLDFVQKLFSELEHLTIPIG